MCHVTYMKERLMILFKGKDGSVAIMVLAREDSSREDAIDRFKAAHDGFYKEHFIVGDDYKLPENRVFRNAWTLDRTNTVVVDKKKALDIHLDRIRKARDAKLDELDRIQLRHLNDKEKLEKIEGKKQLLRDITKNIKLDVNDPLASWPGLLPVPEEVLL